ncbi:hypothetical protein [Rhizobium leguminosarum]|uniref:hypothetical protein n=1 Tax=Rhizobium leguminosarum TaxID=384 RepID=UPI0013BE8088|nr:hypothetical protein [Rhizobium leguminosarum]NEI66481.1 hypothetical protein [Rhizobium leguminosarum]
MSMVLFKLTGLMLVVGLVFGHAPSAIAQASLAAENIIDEVPVTIDGTNGKETHRYTVIRDALNKLQWYYVPNEPAVTLVQNANGPEPEFTLLRYAVRDPKNSLVFNGGGLINFAVNLAAPAGVVPLLKAEITKELNARGSAPTSDIQLAALPFKSANVSIYSPNGDQLGGDPLGTGPAAVFATQKMVFSIPVTELGSDVYEALIHSNTGIPVAVRFGYTGLTPPAGFTVDVDWDQTRDFYSKNEEFRAHASYYGLFGASVGYSATTIREKLVEAKAIKVNIIEGEGFTIEKIDAYLQPILKRINDELLEDFKPPPHIDPAVAPSVSSGGYFGGASYSVGVKSVSESKHGTERIDFRYSKHVERETVASGFVGIGKFSADVQKKLVVVVDNTLWQKSFVPLPVVPSAVDRVNMNIRLVSADKTFDAQNLSFSREKGWRDEADHEAERVSFNLLKLKSDLGDAGVNAARYQIDYTIQANDDSLAAAIEMPVVQNGSVSIAPTRLVDVVTIDPGGLPWKALGQGEISRVSVSLKVGDQDFKHSFRPAMADGNYREPPPISWVVKREKLGGQVKVSGVVEFHKGDKRSTWAFDDLSKDAADLTMALDEHLSEAK